MSKITTKTTKTKKYYIQSGDYKAVKFALNSDTAAIQAVQYMMAEQIPCGLLLFISKHGYLEDFTDKNRNKCLSYFVPNILSALGEEKYAQSLKDHFQSLGFDIETLQAKFKPMKHNTLQKVSQKKLEDLQKAIANAKSAIAKLESDSKLLENLEDLDDLEDLEDLDDSDGEAWK